MAVTGTYRVERESGLLPPWGIGKRIRGVEVDEVIQLSVIAGQRPILGHLSHCRFGSA